MPAAAAPVFVGGGLALAEGQFRPLVALVTLVVALLLQVGVNFVNHVRLAQLGLGWRNDIEKPNQGHESEPAVRA